MSENQVVKSVRKYERPAEGASEWEIGYFYQVWAFDKSGYHDPYEMAMFRYLSDATKGFEAIRANCSEDYDIVLFDTDGSVREVLE